MMTAPQIYPMYSREGYGTVINGNFVAVKYWRGVNENHYSVSVYAFLGDRNRQYQSFGNLADAVAWAEAAAGTHQGQPRQPDKIIHWEMRYSYAITVAQSEDGGYESETFQMCWDIDPSPIRDFKSFPTYAEALQYARDSVDEYRRQDAEHERVIREIGEALSARTGGPGTGA